MSVDAQIRGIEGLWAGPLDAFVDWPCGEVPTNGSIVYTVWTREGAFVYVGLSGRSTQVSARSKGPFGRLHSHAMGRRSGDQIGRPTSMFATNSRFVGWSSPRPEMPSRSKRLSRQAGFRLAPDLEPVSGRASGRLI